MKYKPSLTKEEALILKDMAVGLEYGSVSSDRRVQVKMPSLVVEALDHLFPGKDRSAVLTQLAIEAILEKHRFHDRPDLAQLRTSEQENLDLMWEYLEERDASKV